MSDLIPPKLQNIIDNFSFGKGREKLDLLLEFAEAMPPLPDWLAGQRDRAAGQ